MPDFPAQGNRRLTGLQVTVERRLRAGRGVQTFVYYMGALPAHELDKLCAVPRYNPGDTHNSLAQSIMDPLYELNGHANAPNRTNPRAKIVPGRRGTNHVEPMITDNWQRPHIVHSRNSSKADKIQQYYSPKNRLMSNPILLAAKSTRPAGARCEIAPLPNHPVNNNEPSAIQMEFKVRDYDNDANKPLWIIDGQHRLKGLNQGPQSRNDYVPFVLLKGDAYTPAFIAETFAVVSTTSDGLSNPHKDWLEFTFGLPGSKYESANRARRESFSTALLLVREPMFGNTQNDIFFGNIQVNPQNSNYGYPNTTGFAFKVDEISDIVFDNYYNNNPPNKLRPDKLAEQITWALHAFKSLDANANAASRLFPGANSNYKKLKPLQIGVLSGLISFIAKNGGKREQKWTQDLTTNITAGADWKFDGARTLQPVHSGSSFKKWIIDMVRSTVNLYIEERKQTNIVDYLFGEGAHIEMVSSPPDQNRKLSRNNRRSLLFQVPTAQGTCTLRKQKNGNSRWNNRNLTHDIQSSRPADDRAILYARTTTPENLLIRKRNWMITANGVRHEATGLCNSQTGFDLLSHPQISAHDLGTGMNVQVELEVVSFSGLSERIVYIDVEI